MGGKRKPRTGGVAAPSDGNARRLGFGPVEVLIAEVPSGRLLGRNRAEHPADGATAPILSVSDYVLFGAMHEDGRNYEAEEFPLARAVLFGEAIVGERMLIQHEEAQPAAVYEASAWRVAVSEGRDLALCVLQEVYPEQEVRRAHEEADRVELALEGGGIVGTWVWNILENRFTADARFAQFHGLDPERCRSGLMVEGEQIASVHPDDRAGVQAAVLEALGHGGGFRHEHRVRRYDGAYRWIESRGRVELDETGVPTRFAGVSIDIEPRRQAEQERDAALKLLQRFITAVPGLVYAKDLEGRFLIANRGVTERFGRPLSEYLGKTDLELRTDKTAAKRSMADDRRVMVSGVGKQEEGEFLLPDGEKSVWLSTKEPLRDDKGDVIGLVASAVDITARKKAEEVRNLLMLEVDHRARNALAMVQTVVRLTDASDPASYRERVIGRIDVPLR